VGSTVLLDSVGVDLEPAVLLDSVDANSLAVLSDSVGADSAVLLDSVGVESESAVLAGSVGADSR
jgi:hypothetical protein